MAGRTAGKPVKNAGQTPTVDANHPDVKSLTNAGLGIDRLTQLVTNATKPITHDAISQVPALANQMNEQSLAQQLQAMMPPTIPPLYQEQASAPAFQQMLSGDTTPPVPQNPNIPFDPIAQPGNQ